MRFICALFMFFVSGVAFAFSPEDLRAFGKEAPVQLYVFTSPTCHHCADFHKKILPTLKKEYADTGKAQIIIVDVVRDSASLIANQTLRCLDTELANKLEDVLYANQSKWMKKTIEDVKRAIAKYAAKQGMTKAQFNQCITNQKLQEAIFEQQKNLSQLYGVTGTPTLIMREGTEVRKWVGANEQLFQQLEEAFQK